MAFLRAFLLIGGQLFKLILIVDGEHPELAVSGQPGRFFRRTSGVDVDIPGFFAKQQGDQGDGAHGGEVEADQKRTAAGEPP